jgi:1,4-dihydroxy-2-naphthoate octaprenyltransferase
VLLGEPNARALNRVVIALMYLLIAALILTGRLTPFVALVLLALPRAAHAWSVLGRPRPSAPPAGYVGWPLWYHRACLEHNRRFGWLFILGLAAGAAWPHVRV